MLKVEIERKYDVAPDFTMPRLSSASRTADEVVRSDLSATYFDTVDARLMRFSLALRSRGADRDSGWQLKVPAYPDRAELHWPEAGPAEPVRALDELPSDLVSLLAPFLRGAPLSRCVRLDVTRSSHVLRDGSGAIVAEVADDEVHATGLTAPVRAPRWREIEVELGPSGRAVDLLELERSLLAGGAYVSTSHAKLTRARLGIGNEGLGEARASAGAVLLEYIGRQSLSIIGGHFALLTDPATSVHDVRSAVRRIRSSLRTFADCFDVEDAATFGKQLTWYAARLATVRDAEVMVELVRQPATLDSDGPGPGAGAGAGEPSANNDENDFAVADPTLLRRLDAELAEHRAALRADLGSDRYAELLDQLLRWRESPPFTAAAGRPAKTLRGSVRQAQKQLARQLFAATRAQGSDDDLHRTHRTTRRVGDAQEATSILGSPSNSDATDAVRATRDLLGDFRDHMLAADALRRLAEIASAEAENTFSYGLRAAQHLARAEALRRRLRSEFGGN